MKKATRFAVIAALCGIAGLMAFPAAFAKPAYCDCWYCDGAHPSTYCTVKSTGDVILCSDYVYFYCSEPAVAAEDLPVAAEASGEGDRALDVQQAGSGDSGVAGASEAGASGEGASGPSPRGI